MNTTATLARDLSDMQYCGTILNGNGNSHATALLSAYSDGPEHIKGNPPSNLSPIQAVTVLAYHYWAPREFDLAFNRIEHAFQETWRLCGRLKSVIVVNEARPCVEVFAAKNQNLTIQVEPKLVPGNTIPLSIDCCSRLYTRFSTPYVLTIQDDGWPLRKGLERFIGKWDFIGAPHIRDLWWARFAAMILGYHGMNGGFSLRSRTCCEMASFWWERKYSYLESSPDLSEDIYYTEFLPRQEAEFRRSIAFPDFETAISFSYQKMDRYRRKTLPFGFHYKKSIGELESLGLVQTRRG